MYLTNLFKDAFTSLPPAALADRIAARRRLARASRPIISPVSVNERRDVRRGEGGKRGVLWGVKMEE